MNEEIKDLKRSIAKTKMRLKAAHIGARALSMLIPYDHPDWNTLWELSDRAITEESCYLSRQLAELNKLTANYK